MTDTTSDKIWDTTGHTVAPAADDTEGVHQTPSGSADVQPAAESAPWHQTRGTLPGDRPRQENPRWR